MKIVKIAAALLLTLGFLQCGSKADKESEKATKAVTEELKKQSVKVGEHLNTKYFDVIVNSADFYNEVNTGNQFSGLADEDGTDFLIINVSIKNTSDESRMLTDGKVVIESEGKVYNYDKSETIMEKGWGLVLKQINPLVTVTTNVVYKVPSGIKGSFYYNPARSGEERVFLGSISK